MTQLTPIKGFVNTPVTKNICLIATVLAVLISIFQIKHYFQLSIDPYILEYNQYWRVISYQVSVSNESDYMLTILLWFHFKTLERFYGSNKYLSLILVLALYNLVITFMVMSLGQLLINFIDYTILAVLKIKSYSYFKTILNTITPGPLGILSSLYICFGKVIPISYQFKILLSNPMRQSEQLPEQLPESHSNSKELILTDHFQIHIIYTLLLFNHGFKSIIPCLIGILIGKLYTQDLLPGAKHWLLPPIIFKFFVSPISSSKKLITSIGRRVSSYGVGFNYGTRRGYQTVNQMVEEEPDQDQEGMDDNNDNDREEIIDDIRNNPDNEIRAETPVRPLASQFFDTFRRQS